LKAAHKAEDMDLIDSTMAALNSAFEVASQEMYAQSQEGAAGEDSGAGDSAEDAEVTDVDFEEVEEEK